MLSMRIQRIISTNFLRLMKPSRGMTESYSIYQDLKELPLYKFIKCYCYKEYKELIIQGEPSEEIISDNWQKLLQDYIELIGGDEYKDSVSMVDNINDSTLRVTRIESLLEVINVAPSEGLFEALYTFGYELPKLPYTEANIERLSRLVVANMKRDVSNIMLWKQIIEEKNPTNENKITDEVFYTTLVDLSESFGVLLDEKTISVYTYVMYIKKYRKKLERMAKQQHKV